VIITNNVTDAAVNSSPPRQPKSEDKKSDNWYTPPNIVSLVVRVLGEIDLDPCAEIGKNIPASMHYTATDDGLSKLWHGRVFLNPPYSCPGKWIAKLQAEVEYCRVMEAIALVPASTDTSWLSPVLAKQAVCFWRGRIKFIDSNYEPKMSARQSHVLIYWGNNEARFMEVFEQHGVFKPSTKSRDVNQVLGGNTSPLLSPSTHRKHGDGSGNLSWGYANAA
jgi:phage N-6-adenine-methyltransferase